MVPRPPLKLLLPPTAKATPPPSSARTPHASWAALLLEAHGVDGLCCPKCDGRLKLVAVITRRLVVPEPRIDLPIDPDLAKTDPADWVWESHVIGRRAYDDVFQEPEDQRASQACQARARGIAETRAALAGYRLADTLVSIFGSPDGRARR